MYKNKGRWTVKHNLDGQNCFNLDNSVNTMLHVIDKLDRFDRLEIDTNGSHGENFLCSYFEGLGPNLKTSVLHLKGNVSLSLSRSLSLSFSRSIIGHVGC